MNLLAGGVNKLRIANIVGIVILFLGMFGVNVDDDTRELLISALGAAGLIINQIITEYNARKGTMLSDVQAEKAAVTTVTPATMQGDVTMLSKKAVDQAGFARVPALWGAAVGVGLVLLALSACTSQATLQDSIATGYTAVKNTAQDVAIAQRNGVITTEQALQFKAELQKAQDALNVATDTLATSPSTAATKAAFARQVLSAVILALQRAAPTDVGAPQ